ncbi:hypothetical protein NPIL_379161 [Nephila pilipes]|uniref:SAP domain-containing protein n=1 Tax=Nephila pilipes TaxID=299642 RepID=A0A8X6MZ33_NEPPI|nr:hypothetical protein NPIL_379161 [Nephila pilipes]
MSTNADNVLNSSEVRSLRHLMVSQLKMYLRLRTLSTTGNKGELIFRFIEDNIKRNEDGTLNELNSLRMKAQNVEQLIDIAAAVDEIRSTKQENKQYQSPQSRSFCTRDEQRRKCNPATDDARNSTGWRCGYKGHASFMCILLPCERGSPIAPPRNTSR